MWAIAKWVGLVVLGLLVLALLGLGGFATYVNSRLDAAVPTIAGQARLAGADGPIEIIRDRYGVPHIFAGTEADTYRGLGYAHAQDRFVQMDLTRRSMQGRLSEVVGDRAIEADARARILGWARVAEAQYAKLSPGLKALMQAYAEGVNAALDSMPTPAEYALFFAKPEPWAPEDSLAVSLAMTNLLTGGEESERQRAMLAGVLKPEQIAQFLGPYPEWAARSYSSADLTQSAFSPSFDGERPGSNAWVVSGARTGTGKPVLANDPHLPLNAPGPFYLARLHGPDGSIVGASLPGAGLIVIGRTRDLAWGTTTHQIDAADERPFTDEMAVSETTETIKVNVLGLFTRTVDVVVRRTEEGPVLDPKWWGSDKSFKLAWGEQPVVLRTIADDEDNGLAEAVYRATKAKTVDAYFAALAPWTAPPQNLVVADSSGNIGLISPGRFPRRDANGVWNGEIGRRLYAKNPSRGYFATANNLQTPSEFPFLMPGGHDPFRVTLIDEWLARDAAHSADRAQALQTDVSSLLARRSADAVKTAAPTTSAGKAMQVSLAGWDFNADRHSIAATQFAYFIRALGDVLYKDELGEVLFKQFLGPRDTFLEGVLSGRLSAGWCDDVTTTGAETCPQTIGAAIDAAAAALRSERGADEKAWAWGDVHAAQFRNLVWSGLPLVGDGFTVSVPFGGNSTTVDVARNWHRNSGYYTVHAAGMRMIVDFADPTGARFIVTPGQSGQPRSPFYRNLAPLWAEGQYILLGLDWTPDALPEGAQRLQLSPKS